MYIHIHVATLYNYVSCIYSYDSRYYSLTFILIYSGNERRRWENETMRYFGETKDEQNSTNIIENVARAVSMAASDGRQLLAEVNNKKFIQMLAN